jgi:uncharacterized protein YjbI with pentapeptide repeats
MRHLLALSALLGLVLNASLHASVFRWDNQQAIPGTEDITLSRLPVNLSNRQVQFGDFRFFDFKGTESKFNNTDLSFAKFDNAYNLRSVDFQGATIQGASFKDTALRSTQLESTASYAARDLRGVTLPPRIGQWNLNSQDLTSASLRGSDLTGADLRMAILTHADLGQSNLSNTQFAGAVIEGASFTSATGFSESMLKATGSYQTKNLRGIQVGGIDLTRWNFSGQDLTAAIFGGAKLSETVFSDALISGADFQATTGQGLRQDQLWSTASYLAKDLRGIGLSDNTLRDWNFSGLDLTAAKFVNSKLDRANFTGANLTSADLNAATLNGVNLSKLNLTSANLKAAALTATDFSNANLASANLASANITNANFTGATVDGAAFGDTTTRGFTEGQLRSTASFVAKNLRGIKLNANNLTRWDLSGQDLSSADFSDSMMLNANLADSNVNSANFTAATLQNTSLKNTNLRAANFLRARFTDTDLTDAVILGASFADTTSRGFTEAQLRSTTSYRNKNLRGINLSNNDHSNWNFSGQDMRSADLSSAKFINGDLTRANLASANLTSAVLTGANLTAANLTGAVMDRTTLHQVDMRGAQGSWTGTPLLDDTILPDGTITALTLGDRQKMTIRDYDGIPNPPAGVSGSPIPLKITEKLQVQTGGTLQLAFDADPWDSLIAFQSGISVQLGGSLDLVLAAGTDIPTQVGRTMRVFDWTGVRPQGQFTVTSPYKWDASRLYTSGEVTLRGPLVTGDVDFDGRLTAGDVDALGAAVRGASTSVLYDLNGDGKVSSDDHMFWVSDVRRTWFGDSDFDGEFNSGDLVVSFQSGRYEDSVNGNAGWAMGDWDGDGDFTSGDLVLAFQGGGYEQGPYFAVPTAAVPEPASVGLLLSGLVMLSRFRKR